MRQGLVLLQAELVRRRGRLHHRAQLRVDTDGHATEEVKLLVRQISVGHNKSSFI